MKKYFTLVLLGSMMQFAPGFADEVANEDGKIYVKPRAVRIMKDKIVVFTKDGAFLTPSVVRDEKGIFVQEQELEKAPEVARKGKCGTCRKNWGRRQGFGPRWQKGRFWKMRAQGNKDSLTAAVKSASPDAQVAAE